MKNSIINKDIYKKRIDSALNFINEAIIPYIDDDDDENGTYVVFISIDNIYKIIDILKGDENSEK